MHGLKNDFELFQAGVFNSNLPLQVVKFKVQKLFLLDHINLHVTIMMSVTEMKSNEPV